MSSYQQDTNQTDGQDVPHGFNDVENTVFSTISVTSLSIDAGNVNKTDVGAVLATAITGAQAAVDSFVLSDYLVAAADLPTVADEGNMVVESLFYVSGMNPSLFLGTDAGDAIDFVAHDTANNMYENNAYVTDEVYLDMNDVNSVEHPAPGVTYIQLGAVMAAMKGLLTAVLTIDPVKKSLHKMAYTVDFDVDAGINVQVEDYVPDLILRGDNLILGTDVAVNISDDTADNVTSTLSQVRFLLANQAFDGDVTKVGSDSSGNLTTGAASAFDWAVSGMSSNTLLKGLFGELLAESPIVSAFRDSNENNIVAEDLFELVVKRPGKITSTTSFSIPGADNVTSTYTAEYSSDNPSSWLDTYFKYEHNQLMTELSESFQNIWSDTDNIDWYMTLFNIKETRSLFDDGDVFRVPVDLTLRYELVDNSRNVDTLDSNENTTASGSSLSPCDIKITNLIAGDVPVIERTFRLEYHFNVQNTSGSLTV
tara:strand:- start:365 stop:1807 length:1443 start_codon:yes stop_codon:yes gene_type:complete